MSLSARIIIEKDGEGYHAYIPEIIGLHTEGEDIEDALLNIGGGLVAYMRSVIKHGDKVDLIRDKVVAEGEVKSVDNVAVWINDMAIGSVLNRYDGKHVQVIVKEIKEGE